MIIHVKNLLVVGRGDSATLRNAIYGTGRVVLVQESGDKFAAIVRVEGETDEQVTARAEHQKGRNGSFLWATQIVDGHVTDNDLGHYFASIYGR
jgi:hypothetical protein